MILDSDRLLTSLPFYNHLQKQDINGENNHGKYYNLKVDTWGLKPFQIKTGMACGNITICDLWDADGNSIDLLDDSTYDIDSAIEIKTDGTNHWIIFDGFLAQELPIGHYYIELGDCFNTWYSEWFYTCRICKDPSKMYNNTKKMEYSTHKRGMGSVSALGPRTPINHSSTSPQLYHYNDKTYGGWLQRVGDYAAESMIYAVDHDACSISPSYGVGSELSHASDHHCHPAILVADDGHIVVSHEYQSDVYLNHNKEIIVKRSDEAEDESLWVNANAGNVNYYTSVGSTHSYQQMYKTDDSTIYMFARNYQGDKHKLDIFNSTDHAISWSTGDTVVDFSGATGTADHWIYPSQPRRGTTDRIDIIVDDQDFDGTGKHENLYYLISNDGITWTDVEGNGSKNIVTGGAFTFTELNANKFRVAAEHQAPRTSCLDENGKVYILANYYYTGTYQLAIYEFDSVTSVWNKHIAKDTSGLEIPYANAGNAVIVYRGAGILDVYLRYDEANGTFSLRHYRIDPDDYSEWIFLETVYNTSHLDNSFRQGGYTFNHNDTDNNVLSSMLDIVQDLSLSQETDPVTGENNWIGYTNLFLQFDSGCSACNGISAIKWWNDEDLEDIIYQYGFKNYLYLDKDVVNKEWETTKDAIPRDGYLFPTKIVSKKAHSIVFLAPEYVADMCKLIESHSDVYIVDKLGDEHEVKEINVEITKKDERLFRISINFYVNPTYSSNCSGNKTLTDMT